MSDPKRTSGAAPADDLVQLRARIRAHLEAERQRIAGEIASYPPPIPACDAQFNYLLERRAQLQAALARLARLDSAGLPEARVRESLSELIESTIDETTRRELGGDLAAPST